MQLVSLLLYELFCCRLIVSDDFVTINNVSIISKLTIEAATPG